MGKEIKILFLEDSPADVELNLNELKKAGFNVIPKTVETKADYISALQGFKPDIILADYNLPSFNGMEALDYIKNNAIQTPFILVSGSLGEELAVDVVKRGATDYILKQNLSRLAASVKRSLNDIEEIKNRENAENLLRESELRFRTLYLKAPIGIALICPDNHFLDVNEAFCRIMGYTGKELENKSILEITHPDDREHFKALFENIVSGNIDSYSIEKRCIKKDGKIIWVNGTMAGIRNTDGGFLYGIVMIEDNTERKLSEEKLIESEERYKRITAGLTDYLYTVKVKDGKAIETIHNEACLAVTGYTSKEFGADPYLWINMVVPEEKEFVAGRYLKILEGKELAPIEHRIICKNGKIRWISDTAIPKFNSNGELISYDGIIKDITERKWAEEALRESDEKFRRIFENVQEVYFEVSFDGTVIEVSPSIEIITKGQYRRDKLIGNSIFQMWADDGGRQSFRSALQEHGSVADYEVTLKNRDGSLVLCSMSAKIHSKSSGQSVSIIGSIRDITERKRTEEALKESEEKFRTIFDNVSDGMFLINLVNNKFILCNSACTGMLGYTKDEFLNLKIADIHPPEDLSFINGQIRKFLQGEAGIRSDIRFKMKDGSIIYADLSPAETTISGERFLIIIFRNITERKRSEEALKASEVRYRRLFESAKDGILILDAETGIINDVNPFLIGILGFSYEDFYGKKLWELGFFKDIISNKVNFLELLQKEFIRYENLPMETADGRKIEVEFVSNVYLVDKRKVIQCNIRDITERRRTEEELLRYRDHFEEMVRDRTDELVRSEQNLKLAKNQAEAANRAKTVFLSSMSHEIRTPLNAVLGFSQLMLRDASLTVQQIEWLNTINRSGEHLLALINDILEISRIESGRVSLSPDLFDLKTFLGDMEKMFRVRVEEKNLKLRMEIDEGIPRFIELDGNKLRQIFINLIGNAVKFTDEGMITVRVSAERKEKDNYRLIAEVEDTGPGITTEDLNKIFNKFEQTTISLRKGGTGLGLSISRQFALMMGGDIAVISEAGKGSCFRLELDFKERNAPELEIGSERRIITGLKKGQEPFRILIADDEPANRMLLRDLLSKAGFEVAEASDGREAVKLFKERTPHLVFLDMRMPVMDGYAAIKKMKSLQKDIPVIAVTASAFDENRKKMNDAGIDGYIRKPYKIQEIYDVLKSKLGVQYAYAKAPAGRSDKAGKITEEALRGLPENLAGRMLEAAVRVDLDRLLELIDEAAETAPALSAKLRVMAKSFRYDEIINLLKKRGKI